MKTLIFSALFLFINVFAKPSLVIITASDLHGQVEPIYELHNNKTEEVGGFSRLATKIKSIKNQYPKNSIVAMQGDYLLRDFKMGKYFSKFKGKAIFSLMQKFQIDIATLGNHEFDLGVNPLLNALKYCKFPLVVTNVTFLSKKPKNLHKKFILEKNGYKIGFLGLMTPYLKGYQDFGVDISKIKINSNVIKLTKKNIKKLKEKVDFIVILSHLGLDEDKRLAQSIPDIDIILGGHSHDKTEKEIIIPHANNKKTVIVHSGSFGKYLGVLKIFERDGIKNYTWELIKIDKNIKKDPAMESLINNFKKEFISDSTIQTKSTSTLDLKKNVLRTKEAKIGNLITDIFRKYFKTDIALISGDAIRGNKIIMSENITDYDINNMFLFKNFYIVKVKGKILKKTLEIAVSEFPKKSYNFWQVSGLKLSFDPEKQPIILKKDKKNQFTVVKEGNRILDIKILQKDGSYTPLDKNKEYSIVFNPSLIPSKRDFFLFKCSTKTEKINITPQKIMKNELKKIKTISPKIEGRILIKKGSKIKNKNDF